MANNIALISSIKNEKDFEYIVRELAKHIYDAEAYLVGGPYDGGRDLIYKRMGKEVKEAIQISIQEKSIESKILEDAVKTQQLVNEYGYPNTLTFFWSHPLSSSKKLEIKRTVRTATGISLEIYDATEIDQIITDDKPEILKYLFEHIHKFKADAGSSIDTKARTFFDYLALSRDSTELKTSIIDAQILSSLFGNSMNKEMLIDELEKFNIKRGTADGRIGGLLKLHKIETNADDNFIVLSQKEKIRLDNIINKDELLRKELLARISQFTLAEIGTDLSEKVFELIKQAYSASVDIQISEISFDSPKLSIAKRIVSEIEKLITSNNIKNCKDTRQGMTAHYSVVQIDELVAALNRITDEGSRVNRSLAMIRREQLGNGSPRKVPTERKMG